MTRASQNDRPDRSTIFPEVVSLPPEVLTRHRVRLLDPSTAVRAADGSWPLSTAYRADRLLVPAGEVPGLIDERNEYNAALEPLDVALAPTKEEIARGVHPDLPVPVTLVARNRTVLDRPPDPWAALVALRRHFGDDPRGRRVGLDHLTVSASVTFEGAPVNQGGAVGGVPVNQGGGLGGGRVALHTGNRNPVAMLGAAPRRRSPESLPGRRRPVVAVLDTGIGPHPWLTGGPAGDQVVEVSADFQAALAAHEGSGPGLLLASPDDELDRIQPLLGLTDSHSGHGTFCAGLVHQLCPDARVLSLRVLHTDGFSTEGSVLFALDWLRDRVARAIKDKRPDLLVDVVSLSLGFYAETADPAEVTQVADAIERLTALGVVVVSASGNDATTRPFLPAAFGQDDAGNGNPLLAAVGALNASGNTTAAFSNHGPWVWRWAPGDALVSTVPTTWEGAAGPGLATLDGGGLGPRARTAPDPDDLRTGFAVWAGTSFATPVVAGLVASAMLHEGEVTVMDFGEGRARLALASADRELSDRRWR